MFVCHVHDPVALLRAPVLGLAGVRHADPELGEELAPAQLSHLELTWKYFYMKLFCNTIIADLCSGASKHPGPEQSMGELALPPYVLLGAVEEQREVVVPGHHRPGQWTYG